MQQHWKKQKFNSSYWPKREAKAQDWKTLLWMSKESGIQWRGPHVGVTRKARQTLSLDVPPGTLVKSRAPSRTRKPKKTAPIPLLGSNCRRNPTQLTAEVHGQQDSGLRQTWVLNLLHYLRLIVAWPSAMYLPSVPPFSLYNRDIQYLPLWFLWGINEQKHVKTLNAVAHTQ